MTAGVGGFSIDKELASIRPWPGATPRIDTDEFERRLEKAQGLIMREHAGGMIVGAGASLHYFSGVNWGPSERFVAMLLPVRGRPVFICPAFERGSLESSLSINGESCCWEEDEDPFRLTAEVIEGFDIDRLVVDPAIAFGMVDRLRIAAGNTAFSDGTAIIDSCRMYKSKAEIALLQQAKSMTLEVHRRAARILRPGISTAEVRWFIDAAHRRLGAAGSAVCIALFGKATCYPHGVPDEQVLEENDTVLIDTGCTVEGYYSDITRTYVFGEPNTHQRHIWALERAAQQAAFDAATLGTPCQDVDAAARNVLIQAGLGPDYRLPGLPHRTGHGIGLSIHEAPYLVRGDNTLLSVGMCFSNEPMIVVPNVFGVRLEDHIYMTEDGPVWFTLPSQSIDAPFSTDCASPDHITV